MKRSQPRSDRSWVLSMVKQQLMVVLRYYRFAVWPICCLGNCDKGPAVLIDEDTYGPVQPAEVAQLLELYA